MTHHEDDFIAFESTNAMYNDMTTVPTVETAHIDYRCAHDSTVVKDNMRTCTHCGECIDHSLSYDKEWSSYGIQPGGSAINPTRVNPRYTKGLTIANDVVNLGLDECIVIAANAIYNNVTRGRIYRGRSRAGVVCACVYYAYKNTGRYRTPASLMDVFGITKKNSSRGLKIVNLGMHMHTIGDRTVEHARPFVPTPIHHIREIMVRFDCATHHITDVIGIYYSIKNRSSMLNRARPHSLAAAVVFYWIEREGGAINIKEFATMTNLSELTVIKNLREIYSVIREPCRADLHSGDGLGR
jgi:hypothetical protein